MSKLSILALTILLFCPMPSFAQDLKSSTSAQTVVSKRVDREAVLNRLLKEVEDSRLIVSAARERERKLLAELDKVDAENGKLTERYKENLIEVGALRAQIEFQEQAQQDLQKQIVALREDNARKDGALKSSRKRELLMTLGLIGMAAFLFH